MSKRDVGILRHSAWLTVRRNFMGNGRSTNYAVAILRIREEWTSTEICKSGRG